MMKISLKNLSICKWTILFPIIFVCVFDVTAQQTVTLQYTTSGTRSFIIPDGVTSINTQGWGGGGGGGYSSNNGQTTGGGGGGAYTKNTYTNFPLSGGNRILQLNVGAGGAGSSGKRDGGTSSVNISGNLFLNAVGGQGANDNNVTGAAGGQASDCTPPGSAWSGGNGGSGNGSGNSDYDSGGGGGAAGDSGNGGNGGLINGGTAGSNGGNGGRGSEGNWLGSSEAAGGGQPGGGGGGGKKPLGIGSVRSGGSGGVGRIVVSLTISPPVITSNDGNCYKPGLILTSSYTSNAAQGVSYQWRKDGISIGGATFALLDVTSYGAGSYTLEVTYTFTSAVYGATANTVSLTSAAYPVYPVSTADIIIADPVDACTGSEAVLAAATAAAANVINPVFRWYSGQNTDEILYEGANYPVGTFNVDNITTYHYYVSVSGDNYCENQKGSRKQVALNIYPKPIVQIQTPGLNNTLCHNTTIDLNAVFTGGSGAEWYGWADRNGNVDGSTQFTPNQNAVNVVYNPDPSEAGSTTKLYVMARDRVCGYIADTIRLHILPSPTDMELELERQPVDFQEMCTDTVYVLKVKATDEGDLHNIRIQLADVHATGITIKDAYVKYPYASGSWQLMNVLSSDITGVTWSVNDPLPSGDSLQVQVTVSAECGFFSGTNVEFSLYADSYCGDNLPPKTVASELFFTKQDISQLNTYDITSAFSVNTVTNRTADTVTWRLQAVVHGLQPTSSKEETVVALIPAGLTPIPNSYVPVQNAHARDSLTYVDNEFGIEFSLPMVSGLTEGDVIIAEFKFHATGAPCKTYNFYSEVVFTDSISCGGERCTFHSTRGSVYPTLDVERYRFSLADSVYGRTVDDLWYGNIYVRAETQSYAGDSISVDFYIDRDNNEILSAADTLVRTLYDITRNASPGEVFAVAFDSVSLELEKPFLVKIHGDVLCDDFTFPVATLMGVDTLCRLDTTLYYTSSGMTDYKWNVIRPDGISGATPVRIPLEGSSEANYINENIARVVWKKAGDYTVWAQYSTAGDPSREIDRTFFPVHVKERPAVALTGSADTTVCSGSQVELGQFFTETTGTGRLAFYRVESDSSLTFLSDQVPLYVDPLDTTLYRVSAISESSGCASENTVDFYVNVNRMPRIWSVSVNEQPECGTNTGSMMVSVTGESGNYVYHLNNDLTDIELPSDGIIRNLFAGNYRVYVKNRNQSECPVSVSEPVVLNASNSGLYVSALSTDASSCTSGDGTIQLTANGGIPPYRYRVNDGSDAPLPANGMIGTDFMAGNYHVTIIDAANCTAATGDISIKPLSGIRLTLNQQMPADCTSGGLAEIVISGGTQPYSYRLSGEGWVEMDGNSEMVSIPSGKYKIFAKDATGCETSATGILANTNGFSAEILETADASCDGMGTGSVRLSITGTAPLTYSTDGGKTRLPVNAGESTISDLSPGIYRIMLIDGNGCTYTLDDVHIGKKPDFVQAVSSRAYTYINQGVKGQLRYDDYDLNRQTLTVTDYASPRNGTITVTPSGEFNYTPETDYLGIDSVQYTVTNACGLQSSAWLYIDVLYADNSADHLPVAMDDDYVIQMGQTLSNFDVTSNDYIPDGESLSTPVVVSQVVRGSLTQNGDGTFNYLPDATFIGVDAFTYKVCDSRGICITAQAHIIVLPDESDHLITALPDAYFVNRYDTLKVSNTSVGVLNNDRYPTSAIPEITVTNSTAFGKLEINRSDGTFVYIPNKDYSGSDGFTYALCTNTSAECDTARVSIFIAEQACFVSYSAKDTIPFCVNDSVALASAILPPTENVDTIAFFVDRQHLIPVTGAYVKTVGNYYIRITGTNGCQVSDSVYVKSIPAPHPVITTGSDEACTDDKVLFVTDSGFKQYQWNILSGSGGFMDGSGQGNTEYFVWHVEGQKEVSVTVTADNDCTATATKMIVIQPRTETGPLYRIPNR